MRKFILKKRFSLPEAIALIGIAVFCVSVVSYAVTVPHTFSPGTTAKSGEVNANFAALVSAVTDLEAELTAVTDRLTTAEDTISTLQSNNALLLGQYVTISSATINSLAGPHVIFEGVNVHIQSGGGVTDAAINGLGNLLIGYNEGPTTLNPGDRGGSHNLIVGPEHKYLSFGGLVAGQENTLSNYYTSVSGGQRNTATGNYSSVSGGYQNEAISNYSSVSGGLDNTASSEYSSVSGGEGNTASSWASSVSGGWSNTASGVYSSVSGGYNNNMIDAYGWIACDTYTCTDAGP